MIKVSVCMPNYNYGEFLEQAILSVFNQDYKNIELVVVDDNSTDNSLSIMKHYKKFLLYLCKSFREGKKKEWRLR